ncbi:CaiB/BaiF CoA-transferase family protein [Deinococcus sp. VB142]|uniref:CaiB/BaiF CoA-transferase family protein n=1 Tax=Deinococcus sp. VB142 TaxID=3112952 RepID=A0AAU6Q396_9DEIO
MTGVLSGLTVITLAPNVPGPLAAASLRDAGAKVVKIEGPAGDPLAQMSPEWYAELHRGIDVQVIDLKTEAGRATLDTLLAGADLLLTSSRPGALTRLGLSPERLGRDFPRLCRVTIVGDTRDPEAAGHDLTYQAEAGLIDPAQPAMPRTLMADLMGSREAYAAALALLLGRERGQAERERVVGLGDAARFAAAPYRVGLTAPGGLLSGAYDNYRLYQTADGWIAAAPLEPHFAARWTETLGEDAAATLRTHPTAHWVVLAAERDLPLAALDGAGEE